MGHRLLNLIALFTESSRSKSFDLQAASSLDEPLFEHSSEHQRSRTLYHSSLQTGSVQRNTFSTLMASIKEGGEDESGVKKEGGDENVDTGESSLDKGYRPSSAPAAGEQTKVISLDHGVR